MWSSGSQGAQQHWYCDRACHACGAEPLGAAASPSAAMRCCAGRRSKSQAPPAMQLRTACLWSGAAGRSGVAVGGHALLRRPAL